MQKPLIHFFLAICYNQLHLVFLTCFIINVCLCFQVPKDNPVLRVLFHLGNHHNVVGGHRKICILLTASIKAKKHRQILSPIVSNTCSLKDSNKDGTCLGQLTLPSSWWPSVTPMLKKRPNQETVSSETKFKQPKVLVDVKYSVFEMSHGYSCDTLKGKRL